MTDSNSRIKEFLENNKDIIEQLTTQNYQKSNIEEIDEEKLRSISIEEDKRDELFYMFKINNDNKIEESGKYEIYIHGGSNPRDVIYLKLIENGKKEPTEKLFIPRVSKIKKLIEYFYPAGTAGTAGTVQQDMSSINEILFSINGQEKFNIEIKKKDNNESILSMSDIEFEGPNEKTISNNVGKTQTIQAYSYNSINSKLEIIIYTNFISIKINNFEYFSKINPKIFNDIENKNINLENISLKKK